MDETPSSLSIGPGLQIGPYRLVREIGAGSAVSVVFEAEHTVLRRRAAVKILSRVSTPWGPGIERFRREAEAVARLDAHPNIVRIYDIGEAQGIHYIAMELVEGLTFQDRLESRRSGPPLGWMDVCRIGAKVADALHFAHERGIIHRDVKPSNILMDLGGEPRLTDFGLARDVAAGQELTAPDQILGTPAYMAPEQAEGRTAQADARTDIFSLGVVLFEALAKRHPFEGRTIVDTLVAIRTTEIASLDSIPADLNAVLNRALEKSPARRYPTAMALAGDLRRVLAGDPTLARPPGWFRRGIRSIVRHQRVAVLCAILCGVLGLFITYKVRQSREGWAREALHRGRLRKTEGHTDEAFSEFTRAIDFDPKSAEGYRERAELLRELKRTPEAERDFRMAAALDPKDTMGWYNIGHMASHRAQFDEALKAYGHVLERDPTHARAMFSRGQVFVNLKREEEAERDFRRAGDVNPSWPEPFHELGHLLEKQNRLDEALTAFQEGARRGPKEGKLWYHCASLTARRGRTEEALPLFDAAIENGFFDAYPEKAEALKTLKRYGEALKTLQEGIHRHPKLKKTAQPSLEELKTLVEE